MANFSDHVLPILNYSFNWVRVGKEGFIGFNRHVFRFIEINDLKAAVVERSSSLVVKICPWKDQSVVYVLFNIQLFLCLQGI